MTVAESPSPTPSTPSVNRPWQGLGALPPADPGQRWNTGVRAGFDLETTGKDPLQARIVTASLVMVGGEAGEVLDTYEWLVDPGVEIPQEAAAVHGVSTERARAEGMDSAQATAQIVAALTDLAGAGIPVVAFNAPYDFTVLDREAQRHHVPALVPSLVLDPFVMDKAVDRYRRGKRTLSDVSAHYGVQLLDAHTSAADALAAVLVAGAIATKYPAWSRADVTSLQEVQRAYKAEQAASLQNYLRTQKGEVDAVVDGSWPMIPRS